MDIDVVAGHDIPCAHVGGAFFPFVEPGSVSLTLEIVQSGHQAFVLKHPPSAWKKSWANMPSGAFSVPTKTPPENDWPPLDLKVTNRGFLLTPVSIPGLPQ